MKTTHYILAATTALSIIACNKPGEDFSFDTSQYRTIYSVQARDYPVTHTIDMQKAATIKLNANYSGLGTPANDIIVTFAAKPDLVKDFNNDNQTKYPMLLPASYAIEGAETVIGKGQLNSSQVNINIDPTKFRGVGPYILPVSIVSVIPELSVNEKMKTVFIQIEGRHSSNPYTNFDRSSWDLLSVSSQHNTTSYKAANILDGNLSTFWHTSYAAGNQPGPPHTIVVDMKSAIEIHGFEVDGRTASASNLEAPYNRGNPRIVNFQVSDDNLNWTDMGTYIIPDAGTKVKNYVYLNQYTNGRYFKFTVTATLADYYGTNVSELYLF